MDNHPSRPGDFECYIASRVMSKYRRVFILTGIAFVLLTHVGDTYYRNWVYSNQISDFGLAGYLPSITGTIAAIFFLIGLSKEPVVDVPKSAFWIIVGCMVYEVFQPVVGTGVFDWQDLAAIIITGSMLNLLLCLWVKSLKSKVA